MTAVRRVSRFEADLLRLLRFLLDHLPAEQAHTILHQRVAAPPGLSQNALALIEDTLRKSLVQFLVRGGGWRQDRFLRNGEAVTGHAWNRLPLDERRLYFTGNIIPFLIWLTAEKPSESRQAWASPGVLPTLADHLVFLLAGQNLQAFPEQWTALRRTAPFSANPFLWLAMPAEFADENTPSLPDFAALFAPPGPAILECLQGWLAERWLAADQAKAKIAEWQRLRSRGTREKAALSAFLAAAEKANRRDLARFLLQAIQRRLAGATELKDWTGGLMDSAPIRLAERIETKRAALAMIRPIEVFARWDSEGRHVGYFDDDYAASQFWKAEYETANGSELLAKYRNLNREIDPLM